MDMNDRVKEAVEDSDAWFPELPIDTTPWSVLYHLMCLGGEAGELQNKAKKFMRGSISWEEIKPILADELADVQVYVFLVAAALGIDPEAEYDKKRKINDDRFRPAARARADARAASGDSASGAGLRDHVRGQTQER